MFKTLKNIWRVDDLRKRILFTLFVLIIFRIGSFVPVPGVNKEVLPRRIRQAMSCSVFLTRSRGRTIAVFDLRPFDISIYYCVHYRTVAVDGRHSKVCGMEQTRGTREETVGSNYSLWYGNIGFDPGVSDVYWV